MSHETEFRALLVADAALIALVPAVRIGLNAVGQGSAYPLIVFVAREDREYGLDNTLHGTEVTFDVQCYAKNSTDASAVADAVEVAIADDPSHVVTSRATAFDDELDLDAVVLTVSRWVT